MREILADALVRVENILDGRIYLRRAGQEFEIEMDAPGQIQNAFQKWSGLRK